MQDVPMSPEEIAHRRDGIIARSGPWQTDNIRLAQGVLTIGEGECAHGVRVRRAVQTVLDLNGSGLKGLRVLDLGCGEGGVALELGMHGSEVVAIEGRAAFAEKAEFARESLGLRNVSILRCDLGRLSAEEHGFFDVVVALGVWERLDTPALFDVARRVGAVCKRFALIEARLAPPPLAVFDRSSGNDKGFLLTRVSMLSLIERAGFTSIVETLDPDPRPDTHSFAAFKGRRVALQTAPQVNAVPVSGWRSALPTS